MATHASAAFEVKNWDEQPSSGDGGSKVTQASVTMAFRATSRARAPSSG